MASEPTSDDPVSSERIQEEPATLIGKPVRLSEDDPQREAMRRWVENCNELPTRQ